MVLLNGKLSKLGFFLAQWCLDSQVRGNIGKNIAFASSSIARKTMVEILYGAPQWDIPQDQFLSCLIVSTYSTTMTKSMFPLLAPQLQKKQRQRCSMMLLNGRFHKLGFFIVQLIPSFFILNVYHALRNTYTLVMQMLDVKNKLLCDNLVKKRMITLSAT